MVMNESIQQPPFKQGAAIPSLDGIRALAITLVFLAHGGLSEIVPGGVGVTMFFVLSGFLITTLMRVEYAAAGRLDLPAFYLRRVFRLMPPLMLMVMLALLLTAALGAAAAPTLGGVASVLFYFSNYFSILQLNGIPEGLGVTWSLAVEEHFYIVFPLLAPLLLRNSRVNAVVWLGIACAAILAWRCWLIAHGAASDRIYMATDTRIDSILIGCAMALLWNPVLDPVHAQVRRHTMAICCTALIVLMGTFIYRTEYFRYSYRFTIQSLALAPLIYLAVAQSRHAVFRWLNAGPVVYLGKISYTVYLAHQVCLHYMTERWPTLGMVSTMAATALLTLAIAEPMRRWVEMPFAWIRKRMHQQRTTGATLIVTAAIVKTTADSM